MQTNIKHAEADYLEGQSNNRRMKSWVHYDLDARNPAHSELFRNLAIDAMVQKNFSDAGSTPVFYQPQPTINIDLPELSSYWHTQVIDVQAYLSPGPRDVGQVQLSLQKDPVSSFILGDGKTKVRGVAAPDSSNDDAIRHYAVSV